MTLPENVEAKICSVSTKPFADQNPGTSGLRKKTKVFLQPHYLENFIQSVFNTLLGGGKVFQRSTLLLGGDGRFLNAESLQTIIRMAAANGFARVLVARDGILSTPAASAVIRRRKLLGGLVLTASHNPGGPEGDFGIKFNPETGAPASTDITDEIYRQSRMIDRYHTCESRDLDLLCGEEYRVGNTDVEVLDPLCDYTDLLREYFDFDFLGRFLESGFTLKYDAMNAVTGPYAKHILEECLGALPGTVIRGTPMEDFGGIRPDPNRDHAAELVALMDGPGAPNLGAAGDADGDRNLILGPKCYVSPGDSLAIIAEHLARAVPGYKGKILGVARSMPTSTAADRVADALGFPVHETPTGWKFFFNLLESGKCTICGEESFGTGSSHLREKDGLWAVLAWLSIMAHTGQSVAGLLESHWRRFGRSYYQRHDYEGLPSERAQEGMKAARKSLPELEGKSAGPWRVVHADDFMYTDPVTGEVVPNQGLRIFVEGGHRVVARLSGTDTTNATLRVYLERYEPSDVLRDAGEMLGSLARAAGQWLALEERFGVSKPTHII